LPNTSPLIDPASQAVIATAQEGEAVFDRTKKSAHAVLPLGRSFSEPAVIGQVHQEIDIVAGVFAAFFCSQRPSPHF